MTESHLASGNSIQKIEITKVTSDQIFRTEDELALEEPLEIRVMYGDESTLKSKTISVTMRTPGNDHELATGFLFTEGIISNRMEIDDSFYINKECGRAKENVITVRLKPGIVPELMNVERNFYTTSSCGVCGKASIASIKTVSPFQNQQKNPKAVTVETLFSLPEKMEAFQNNFSSTGGIHSSGLFDMEGNLLTLREDVGRHNALDKLIGHLLHTQFLPAEHHILLLSGRASFELIQKAAMAGIRIVASIGAPSSLAVDLAKEFDITLIGFLRNNRFNIYHQGSDLDIKN